MIDSANKITVWIPPALREFVGGAETVAVEADTVAAALAAIGGRHAGFLNRVLSPEGEVRPLVNIFVGEDNIRDLEGLETPLSGGHTLAIIPAIAGG
jgi:molybdopterin converting factor small subunit